MHILTMATTLDHANIMAFLNSGKSHLAYVPAFTLLNPKA
jgi:hypothetical protein